MLSAILVFAGSMLVAVALTPWIRRLAMRVGAIDRPSDRRVHAQAIPRLGGLAIVVAFFASLLALFLAESEVARVFYAKPRHVTGLVLGGLLLCALGALDDVRGVRAIHKLWAQCCAAIVAYMCGFRIDVIKLPFFGDLDMGVFGIVVTALWIVAIVNAINLIDGLDGLASGVAFFACVTNFVVGSINNDPIVMLLSASLGGSVLGFLLFNFNPASIFMGDSGSMFLGFVLATTSILGNSVKSSTTVAILVPFVALGLPIMDTLLAMLRRFLERRSIFAADRGHIHHQLLAMGLTHRRAVLILYALSVLFTAGAIVVSIGRNTSVGAALVVVTIAVVGVIRALGNFNVAIRRWIRRERIRSAIVERMRRATPSVLEELASASALRDLPGVLESYAERVQLAHVELTGIADNDLDAFEWSHKSMRVPSRTVGSSEACSVTASYPVHALGASAILHFSWIADSGEVGAEAEILLQLVADALDDRVARGATDQRRSAATLLRSV
jgi:UDP-GlcNAc:undecaprenyl-phosphate GlcNAc-1-phosphate transferase